MVARSRNLAHDMDEGMRGWINRYARDNLWRMPSSWDLDDLVQEGFFVFAKLRIRYPDVRQKRHFMALLKSSFKNRITDLSNGRTRFHEVPFAMVMLEDDTERTFLEGVLSPESDLASVLVLVKNAPKEVREVFELLMSDAGLTKLYSDFRRDGGSRETTNEFLCRLLGRDPTEVDISALVRGYLAA